MLYARELTMTQKKEVHNHLGDNCEECTPSGKRRMEKFGQKFESLFTHRVIWIKELTITDQMSPCDGKILSNTNEDRS